MDVDVHENQFVPPPNIVITEALPKELPKIPPAIIQPANFIPPGNLVHTPNGTIIIEELDTPEIRRFKNNRRKAEKKRLAAEASAANVVPAPVSVPSQTAGAGPSTLPSNGNHENFEMESDLSSLSDGGNEELEGRRADRALVPPPPLPPPVPVPIAVPSSLKIGADPPAVMLKEGQRLEGGTLGSSFVVLSLLLYPAAHIGCVVVWAKAGKRRTHRISSMANDLLIQRHTLGGPLSYMKTTTPWYRRMS